MRRDVNMDLRWQLLVLAALRWLLIKLPLQLPLASGRRYRVLYPQSLLLRY